jgi:hypothetical protein
MSCSQLVIQSLVSIAVLVGDNDTEERVGCSGCLFNFVLGKLASTPAGEHPVAIVRHVVSFSAFSKPGKINLSKRTLNKSYVSKLWSGLLVVPVTSAVRRVGIKPPEISSSSLWDILRAPMRVSTRLLSWFDIRFSFLFLVSSPDTLGLADQVAAKLLFVSSEV